MTSITASVQCESITVFSLRKVALFVIIREILFDLSFCAVGDCIQTESNLCDSSCAGENSVFFINVQQL